MKAGYYRGTITNTHPKQVRQTLMGKPRKDVCFMDKCIIWTLENFYAYTIMTK